MDPNTGPSGEDDALADALDAYLRAVQARDTAAAARMLAERPELAAWHDCLRNLDDLADSLAPEPASVPAPRATDAGTEGGLPRP